MEGEGEIEKNPEGNDDGVGLFLPLKEEKTTSSYSCISSMHAVLYVPSVCVSFPVTDCIQIRLRSSNNTFTGTFRRNQGLRKEIQEAAVAILDYK